jgi:hypothetical protein
MVLEEMIITALGIGMLIFVVWAIDMDYRNKK